MGCPRGCPDNIVTGMSYVPGSGLKVQSLGSCEGVTIDLLNMFLRLFICVKTNNLYDLVKISQTEVSNGENILNLWIKAKELDPSTCDYQDKLFLIQELVNRIVAFGRC